MNHYERLGVPRHASEDDIKRAFRKLAWGAHPDRGGGDPELMSALNKAYEVLMDPELRQQYDESGDDRRMPPLDYQARDAVMLAIKQALEMDTDVQLVLYMTDGFRGRANEIRNELAMIPARIARIERRAKRVRGRAGKPNLVQMVAAQRVEQLGVHRQQLEAALPVIERAIEMVNDLEWIEEQVQIMMSSTASGITWETTA